MVQVSDSFVPQYYYILQRSPELLHQFYRDGSKLGWSDAHGALESVSTIDVGTYDTEFMVSCEYVKKNIEFGSELSV